MVIGWSWWPSVDRGARGGGGWGSHSRVGYLTRPVGDRHRGRAPLDGGDRYLYPRHPVVSWSFSSDRAKPIGTYDLVGVMGEFEQVLRAAYRMLALCGGAAPRGGALPNGGRPKAPRGNPLAGMRWGVYEGPTPDGMWPRTLGASGGNNGLLEKSRCSRARCGTAFGMAIQRRPLRNRLTTGPRAIRTL